jgi:predicted MFS family arabinose efflux permease
VPLGDVEERRRLTLRLFGAVSLALVVAGLAPSFWVLVAASVAIGMTAAVTHIIVPMAPELAGPGQGGRALGIVMTGLLLGVLLGRVASGAVAEALGWRAVFLLGAVSTIAVVPLLRRRMPEMPSPGKLSYREALASLWDLIREQPILREAALLGFLVFAAFIAFWTNLTFLLGSPHYRLGAGVAGSFGLVGAAGAMIAAPMGKLADRHGARVYADAGAWAADGRVSAAVGVRVSSGGVDRRRNRAGHRTADDADLQPDPDFQVCREPRGAGSTRCT